MEISGQARGLGMPHSKGFTNPIQLNQELATKLPSATGASILLTRSEPGCDTITSPNQTLNHEQQPQHTHIREGGSEEDEPAAIDPIPNAASALANKNPIKYRECLKNHAAHMGGHVLDGCGEFMPSGEEGTQEALKCAACDCHRNFHRKEVEGEQQKGTSYYPTQHLNRSNNTFHHTTRHHTHPPITITPSQQQQRQQNQHKYTQSYPHVFSTSPHTRPTTPIMVAFGGNNGAPAELSSEDLNMFHTGQQAQLRPSYSMTKKRFRTKFTQEQKDKMQEFAERIGWRMQKQDDQEVQQFCDQMGIKRQVFKVWMHNNKQAIKKKQM